VGNIDRYPTYNGGKVTEVVVYANYIGLRWFYQYVVNIGRWSPYEGGQLDRFHCTTFFITVNAVHVLGDFSAHHQELKNCIHSIQYM
jgi:hypothetical protein